MRPLTLRALGLLALVVSAITCADAPTGPRRDGATTARIGLAPSFSAEAARAYRGLASFGFDVASVRIRLTAADGTVARDTTIAFPATQDTLQVDLDVQMQGGEQTFTALIELRGADGVVLFRGTRVVTARSGGLPGASPPSVPLDYAGPGRDARSITVSPANASVPAGSIQPLTAAALDAAGNAVPDLLVRWTSSDTTLGAVTATGSAAAELRGAGRRGTVTITATSPTGLSASARLALVPAPARLVVTGGAGQSGVAGGTLTVPFAVELQAADGGPVPGIAVTFRAATAGGVVGSAAAVTDAAGRASSSITLGRTAGPYLFEAAAGTLAPASVAATATPAPASALALVSGDGQSDFVGRPLGLPFVVRVVDAFGAPVAGATVDWTRIDGAGSLAGASSRSDTSGLATMTYTLGVTPSVEHVGASLAGATGAGTSVDFTVRSIAIAREASTFVLVRSAPGTIPIGAPASSVLSVQVADAKGIAIAQAGIDATLTLAMAKGGPPPVSTTATSDSTGLLTFRLPAYVGAIGTASLTVTAPGFTPLVAPQVAFVAGATASLAITTQPSASAPSGVPFAVQPSVRLEDAGANPVAAVGVKITAFIASGGGTLGGTTTAATDATGAATFAGLSITGSTGQRTLGFSSAGLSTVKSGPIAIGGVAAPAALDTVPGFAPQRSASSGAVLNAFRVRLVDSASQPVARAGVPVTLRATPFGQASPNAALGGTVTQLTDGAGEATFDDVSFDVAAGTYALSARADSSVLALPVLALVDSLTLFTGPAASIAVSTGARTLGASGTTIPAGVVTFQVTDALGATTPSRSYTLTLSATGNCSIARPYQTVNTGFTSAASVPVDVGPGTGGCVVSATTAGASSAARAQVAVPPANATHVWFGSAGSAASAWEGAAGWVPVPPMTPGSWPSSRTSDDAYVPFWSGQFTTPQLTMTPPPAAGPLAIHRLQVDSFATVDLGGHSLVVAGDSARGVRSIEASGARIANGRILVYGAGALVSGGVFDQLWIGDTLSASTNFCASNTISATLRSVVVTNALDVHCTLVVDSTVTAGAVSLSGPLSVTSGAVLQVGGNLSLAIGAALDVAAGANVQVAGACTGRIVNKASVTGAGTVNGKAITSATCAP